MKKAFISLSITVIAILVTGNSFAHHHKHKSNIIDSIGCKQLVVVITDDWQSVQGNLYFFTRQKHTWQQQFTNPVVVGQKGLGAGDGIASLPFSDNAPHKKEGDKKAPAGIFVLGPAFGYADAVQASWIKTPYVKASDILYCVDDVQSKNYNRLITTDTAGKDYNSFEYMHRKDDLYKWGLYVAHNAPATIPGDGSCIFMHIWENNTTGTDGCTAMEEKNILMLLHVIDSSKHPLLVQMPKAEYLKLSAKYKLPELKQ